jgi:Methyltransferase domain
VEEEEIKRIHQEFWRPGWGSVTWDEMLYFQDLIRQHRPESFIEIGTASGLSGGLILRLLDEYGGRRFTTVDHDNSFFGDPTKENGFQLPMIYAGGRVEVTRLTFTTATDLPARGETYEMGFVDANHQHPWPLMDTLCLYPVMRGSKIVLEHDLDLYRKQTDKIYGIGPKYLYDQFPDSHRDRSTANHGNLFSLSLDLPIARIEEIGKDGFALPWSLRTAMQPRRLKAIREVLREYYDPSLLETFNECVTKFNVAI